VPRCAAVMPGAKCPAHQPSGYGGRLTARDAGRHPAWVTRQRRPFPDANLLLLRGRQPALVDSGFTSHTEETAAGIRAHTGHDPPACEPGGSAP
jgi:hypothetical protein